MQEFFQQYFADPIVTQGVAGYNVFNTPVYAIIFALAVFGTWRLLQRLRLKIDRTFLIGILPYIVAGGVWRVVRDSQIIESPLLVTPLIYFVIFAVTVVALLASVGVERLAARTKLIGTQGKSAQTSAGKKRRGRNERFFSSSNFNSSPFVPSSYYKIWFAIGAIVVAAGFVMLMPLPVQNWNAIGIIAALSIGWAIVLAGANTLSRRFKFLSVFTKENAALLWVHMFDATTTFTALQFFSSSGYYEQHVVSSAIIDAIGPVGQFLLKLVVLIPVLWLLDRELSRKGDAQLRGFIKIAILILGLALGVRNGLRLGLGV